MELTSIETSLFILTTASTSERSDSPFCKICFQNSNSVFIWQFVCFFWSGLRWTCLVFASLASLSCLLYRMLLQVGHPDDDDDDNNNDNYDNNNWSYVNDDDVMIIMLMMMMMMMMIYSTSYLFLAPLLYVLIYRFSFQSAALYILYMHFSSIHAYSVMVLPFFRQNLGFCPTRLYPQPLNFFLNSF